MHGLNSALDILRSCMPIQQTYVDLSSTPQKLSKIETLRLAANYITVLNQMLKEEQLMDIEVYIEIMSRNLSQSTANLLETSIMKNSARNFWEESLFTEDSSSMNRNKSSTQWISSYTPTNNYWTTYRFNSDYYWCCNDNYEHLRYWNHGPRIFSNNSN